MAFAARQFDLTNHPGSISTASTDVLIDGQGAARAQDTHACAFPPPAGPHPTNVIIQGSTSVLINGLPAARVLDLTGCGATIASGSTTVMIGD